MSISENAEKESLKPLRGQISWTLPANVLYGVCSLMLLVVLNKLGNESVAGRFSLVLAIAGPIFLFANLRFNTILASDRRETVWLSDYFSLRGLLLAVCFSGVVISLLARKQFGIAVLLVFVALAKSVEGISDLCCGVQQRIERMDRVAISLMANGVAMLSLFAAGYYFTASLAWAALGLLVGRLGVLVLYDLPMVRRASGNAVFQGERVEGGEVFHQRRVLLMSALPLGVTSALIALTSNIPCYVIPAYFDEKMLGLFASVAVVRQAGSLVFRAVEQPAVPRLAKAIEEKDKRQFWRVLLGISAAFLVIGIVGAVVSLLIGGRVLSVVFTPEYETLGGVLALMMMANAIGQVTGMVESSLIAARVIKVQVPMHVVTTLMCLALSVTLIPLYELYGAVVAMSACRIPFMLVGLALLHRKLGEPGYTSPTQEVVARKIAA